MAGWRKEMLGSSAVTHLGWGIYLHRKFSNENGPEFVLKIPANFTIEVDGDQRIRATGNVIRESSRTPDPRRPGYIHAIWDNCPTDEHGNPRQVANLYNSDGEHVATWVGIFDENGKPDIGETELTFTPPRPHDHAHDLADRVARLEDLVSKLTEGK